MINWWNSTQIKKASFTANADAYIAKLKKLDDSYTKSLSEAKQKNFVTQHAAFRYLALDYGLNQSLYFRFVTR